MRCQSLLVLSIVFAGCPENTESDFPNVAGIYPASVDAPAPSTFDLSFDIHVSPETGDYFDEDGNAIEGRSFHPETSTLDWIRSGTDESIVSTDDPTISASGSIADAGDATSLGTENLLKFKCIAAGTTKLDFKWVLQPGPDDNYEGEELPTAEGEQSVAVQCSASSSWMQSDPESDWVCSDEPGAQGPQELDIVNLSVVSAGGNLEARIDFAGDIENYNSMLDSFEGLPLSLQLYFKNQGYLEAFFSDRDAIKVADAKAIVEYSFYQNGLQINLSDVKAPLTFEDLEAIRFSVFAYSFGNYSGSCDDEVVIDTL